MDAETIANGLNRPKKTSDGWMACCPAHEDRTPSLSIADGDKGVVVKCFAGCGQADVIDALKSRGLWPTPTRTNGSGNGKARRTIAAEYDYASEDGELLYQVLRYEPKDFRQRRPDGNGWAWNLKGVTRVPYRLPELLNSTKGIIVCEGEKDADALAAIGVTATTCAGGAEKWQASYSQYFAGRTVFILPDNDEPGRKHAQNVAQHLHGTARSVHVVELPDLPDKGDVSDWLAAGGTRAELVKLCAASPVWEPAPAPAPAPEPKPEPEPEPEPKAVAETSTDGIRSLLLTNSKGDIVPGVNNALTLLGWHPETTGCFKLNTLTREVTIAAPPPWHEQGETYPRGRNDADDVLALAWLERQECKISLQLTHNCLNTIAEKNKFNPLADWLMSLEWDGKPRIGMLLIDCFGAADNEYNRCVGRRWPLSAVARILNPGCKVDHMLVLEGVQGKQKSSCIEALFGEEYYTAGLPDISNKDAAMTMAGKWVIEVAELASINKADHNTLKDFLSRRIDRYRPPFGRSVIEVPRTSIMVGTLNPEQGYLRDSTGARRFQPVKTGKTNLQKIIDNREQIWAEAVHWYLQGEQWWLTDYETKLAEQEQADRYESDPWHEVIIAELPGRDMVTVQQLMRKMDIPKAQQNHGMQMRIGRVLTHEGWKRVRRRENGRQIWAYVRPKEEGE